MTFYYNCLLHDIVIYIHMHVCSVKIGWQWVQTLTEWRVFGSHEVLMNNIFLILNLQLSGTLLNTIQDKLRRSPRIFYNIL